MRSLSDIKKKLTELRADERVSYSTATVFENAPLALIQLSIETKIATLEWILETREGLVVG